MDDPTLDLTQPADPAAADVTRTPLYAIYERSYRRHPMSAARKLAWLGEQIRRARERGDQKDVDSYDEARAALEALMSHLGRCRRCGRTLRDPDSVSRGIGPECLRKAS